MTPRGETPERRIVLHAATHDTAMTERLGRWSIYCGCGWKVQDCKTAELAEAAVDVHLRETL